METKTNPYRLFFIDAIRAWAILMMLQGHFIDGLLDPIYRDKTYLPYQIWSYFRGITAPVFFTVSGFIFTYLLVRAPQIGIQNPRVKKGIKRGLQLVFIGYLLRMNLWGLLQGQLYDNFYLVDVLHCIGLSILTIVAVYLITIHKNSWVFGASLFSITIMLFLLEPIYKNLTLEFFPKLIANYFTKANGSVFTIIPWLGYTTMGAFLALNFRRFAPRQGFYTFAIPLFLMVAAFLIFGSSPLFYTIYEFSGIGLFEQIYNNNYLFIRLGDVFAVFAVFMLLRNSLKHPKILQIGSSTLTIYVVHFMVLYGSFTGLGLYRFWNHELSPVVAIPGAILFMFACTYLSLRYLKEEALLKAAFRANMNFARERCYLFYLRTEPFRTDLLHWIKTLLARIFSYTKG